MRALGTLLMGFGSLVVAVAAIAGLGPALRAAGIDAHAATTSTTGTALVGVAALAARDPAPRR